MVPLYLESKFLLFSQFQKLSILCFFKIKILLPCRYTQIKGLDVLAQGWPSLESYNDWLHNWGPAWLELDRDCFKGEEILVNYPWDDNFHREE